MRVVRLEQSASVNSARTGDRYQEMITWPPGTEHRKQMRQFHRPGDLHGFTFSCYRPYGCFFLTADYSDHTDSAEQTTQPASRAIESGGHEGNGQPRAANIHE